MGTSAKFLCPQCSRKLQPGPEGSERLDCQNCPLSYPLHDGVPVLVMKQASACKVAADDEFERLISEVLQAPFSGWDFSWLEGRRELILASPGRAFTRFNFLPFYRDVFRRKEK